MQTSHLSMLLCASFLVANLSAVAIAGGETQIVLHNFTGTGDGANPDYVGRLVRDPAGNLFGVRRRGCGARRRGLWQHIRVDATG